MASRKTCWKLRLLGAAMVVLWSLPAGAAVINISYADSAGEGFYDPALGAIRQASMERAAAVWESYLASDIIINVKADFLSLGGSGSSATLGAGGPRYIIANFLNAPIKQVYYPSALGEAIAGKNYTGVQADIVVYFNSDVDGSVLGDRDWHYGADLPTGSDIDFQTVAMHELAHGLGIVSSFESDGSWGRGSKPYIFDTMLVNAAGERLIDLPVSGANVTSEVYFDGAAAAAAYQALGGSWLAPIYAPSTWREGSSLSHLDEATFTGADDFMTPLLNTPQRDINPVVLGMMQDLGWSVVPEPTTQVMLALGAAALLLRRRIVPQLS